MGGTLAYLVEIWIYHDIGCHLNAIDEQGNEKKRIPKSQDCQATQRLYKNTEYFQGSPLYKITEVTLGIRIGYSARYTHKFFLHIFGF